MEKQTATKPEALKEEEIGAEVLEEASKDKEPSEADKWRDKCLRAMAELENIRKRSAREVDDARRYGVANFARELLNVQDNLVRALEAMTMENKHDAKAHKSMVEGVEMVANQLSAALTKMDIKLITSMGEKFDPKLHQAMFEVPTNDHEPGVVVQEVQPGYTIAGRLLRPAMVGISKKVDSETTKKNNNVKENKV